MMPSYTTSTPAPPPSGLADLVVRSRELRQQAAVELSRLASLVAATTETGSLNDSQISMTVCALGTLLMACDGLIAQVRLTQRLEDLLDAREVES